MRVAFVAPHPIAPPDSGDRVRAAQLVPALGELGVDVHLIWAEFGGTGPGGDAPGGVPGRPGSGIGRAGWRAWLAAARLRDPYAIHRWPPLRRRLAAAIEAVDPDVVDFQHSFCWFPVPRPSVVTMHNVDSHRLARGGTAQRVLRRVEAMERAACRGADVAVTLSELDAARLRPVLGGDGSVVIVPLGYDPGAAAPPVRERAVTAAFVGSFGYGPNADAARDLVERWPEIRLAGGFERLVVIGKGAAAHVRTVPGVEVRSDVANVPAALADADVLVAPVTTGGGVRVKIIEAMALGIPVVTTAIGIEGLGAVDGVHAAIAPDLGGLAEACRAVRPVAVRRAMTAAARALWEASFSPGRMAEGMLAAYERALAASGHRPAVLR